MKALRDAVLENWRVAPSDFEGTARVQVAMVLRRTGEVESLSLSNEHPAGAGEPTLQAIRSAQPFGELPPQAACLAGQQLRVHFTLESFAASP